MKRMTTGTMAMSEEVKRYCHSTRYWPMKVVTPTVRGWMSGDCASVNATTNSFQAAMKASRPKVASTSSPIDAATPSTVSKDRSGDLMIFRTMMREPWSSQRAARVSDKRKR